MFRCGASPVRRPRRMRCCIPCITTELGPVQQWQQSGYSIRCVDGQLPWCLPSLQLEYIDGEIWANIWQTECIARICPDSGKVKGWVLMHGLRSNLAKRGLTNRGIDVLNGEHGQSPWAGAGRGGGGGGMPKYALKAAPPCPCWKQ
jgi:hypothetical protein